MIGSLVGLKDFSFSFIPKGSESNLRPDVNPAPSIAPGAPDTCAGVGNGLDACSIAEPTNPFASEGIIPLSALECRPALFLISANARPAFKPPDGTTFLGGTGIALF